MLPNLLKLALTRDRLFQRKLTDKPENEDFMKTRVTEKMAKLTGVFFFLSALENNLVANDVTT